MAKDPKLLLQASPMLRQGMTTPTAMFDVWIALAPATLAALWFFGLSALLVLLASIIGAVLTEWVFTAEEKRGVAMRDNSAALTGLLLGLTLPPGLPLWMAFIGGMVATGMGKVIWGGLGTNLFNPALLGRAFLLATFPIAMTTWAPSAGPVDFFTVHASNLAMPFMQAPPTDALSAATPLGQMKFEQSSTPFMQLLIGNTSGSIGETSGLLLILGGLFLWLRRDIDWRIPAAIFISAALFSGVLYMVDSVRYPGPIFTLFSGGMLLGAIYMATDPVTSPVTPKGAIIFGIGIGLLVVLIRVYGGFPEGMMYAVLLMNAATPLIDRKTQPRVFGREVKKHE
ncbi:electron transporter RnfD [Solemya pervernicosa gill symbiont]|uniref:Ion-translocating oxidoreductase complex subunit D n=2 Tax=Gammaproteobacteria incertae sedis TaxID=118884 RepID=A0A1T2L315_9GAMM|nr:RnfABCDGE type electron transport complex subunit D [Candidatus Reidiella endopervernicosa]OOZ39410.1 electron transporter RnfD [Solemya pervernicosa gill symbiont]QKQ26935.1 RnfABCDGE type electron transport complex subunit D [Candidatus Reidiella endopervernicosa]